MNTLIGSVPDEWRSCLIGECCDVLSGPSGSVLRTADYVLDGIPVVRAENVGRDIVPDYTRTVRPETAERLDRHRLRPDDVVLVRIGVTTRFATVSGQHDGWVLGGSCLRLRARPDVRSRHMVPGYLACYLAQPAVQGWLADQTRRGVRSTLRASTLRDLPLVVPPQPVQETITATARAVDAKIRAHEEVVRNTKALRGVVLSQLFTGGAVSR